MELEYLLGQQADIAPCDKRVHCVLIWVAADDVERANADGASRTKDGQPFQLPYYSVNPTEARDERD